MAHSILTSTATATARMRGTRAAHATTHDRLMPRKIETWYPRDCLVCVIDDPEEARRAALALREAGFVEDDVRLARAQEIVALDDAGRTCAPLARLVAGVRTLGDEGLIASEYVAEARRGHHLLITFAPGDIRMRHAHALVARYRAHTVHYFGRWIIRGL